MNLSLRRVRVEVPAVHHVATVAFWAAALGASPRVADGDEVELVGIPGTLGLRIVVRDDVAAGYRLDLAAADPAAAAAAAAALVSAGAQLLDERQNCHLLRDPAGLTFAVEAAGSDEPVVAPSPDRARLELAVIDLPAPLVADGVAFWGRALGVAPRRLPAPVDHYTLLRTAGARGDHADLLVQDVGATPPRVHVDLHVDGAGDVEVARLLALGATRVATRQRWEVLADPAGNLVCLVPQ